MSKSKKKIILERIKERDEWKKDICKRKVVTGRKVVTKRKGWLRERWWLRERGD